MTRWNLRPTNVQSPVYPRVCGGTGRFSSLREHIQRGVYPRVCGGTAVRWSRLMKCTETVYPRVCGGTTTAAGFAAIAEYGSIPACAGEPQHSKSTAGPTPTKGLSPRVRGNHDTGVGDGVYPRRGTVMMLTNFGSIPACAGEPIYRLAVPEGSQGLSPRVRGNPALSSPPATESSRSIPACAGEPLSDLYLFPPLLRSYRLIVLHQVDPVSIDYLLRLLSQYLNSLAAYRR